MNSYEYYTEYNQLLTNTKDISNNNMLYVQNILKYGFSFVEIVALFNVIAIFFVYFLL